MVLIWMLLACKGDSDRQVYLKILASDGHNPHRDLQVCAGLSTPNLAGDCALVVATRAEEPLCDRVPSGVWRDECWFQSAEKHRQRNAMGDAREACSRSGQFQADCDYHVWTDEIAEITRLSFFSFQTLRARGEPLFQRWSLHAEGYWPEDTNPLDFQAPEPHFEAVFWTRFYQRAFESSQWSSEDCTKVEETRWCRAGYAGAVSSGRRDPTKLPFERQKLPTEEH